VTATNWPYNTRQWQRLAKMHLAEEPLCRYCKEMGRITSLARKDMVVDHIVPVKERPDLAFDVSNLQTLCRMCHDSVKRRFEATGKRVGCKQDGTPVDPGHWWNE
jgi:5-methylcytosine-specific restriction enzyme A